MLRTRPLRLRHIDAAPLKNDTLELRLRSGAVPKGKLKESEEVYRLLLWTRRFALEAVWQRRPLVALTITAFALQFHNHLVHLLQCLYRSLVQLLHAAFVFILLGLAPIQEGERTGRLFGLHCITFALARRVRIVDVRLFLVPRPGPSFGLRAFIRVPQRTCASAQEDLLINCAFRKFGTMVTSGDHAHGSIVIVPILQPYWTGGAAGRYTPSWGVALAECHLGTGATVPLRCEHA